MVGEEHRFTADILERSALGLAGFATTEFLERDPSLETRYPEAFASWKRHFNQELLELSAALAAGNPRMFLARVHWSTRAFMARGQQKDDLSKGLAVLGEVLTENLPETAGPVAQEWIELAVESLREGDFDETESVLDSADPHGRAALQFIETALRGDATEAIEELVRMVRSGTPLVELYTRVLLPAQREIGRLWHLGKLSVVEEHLITGATRRAMSLAAHAATRSAPNGKTVVVAAVAGNTHDLGLQAVADLFELAGWRTIFLGADVPAAELPPAVSVYSADLLVLSAVLSVQVARVREAITAVSAQGGNVKVLVGGPAFDEFDSVAEAIGADAFVPRIEQVVEIGAGLVG